MLTITSKEVVTLYLYKLVIIIFLCSPFCEISPTLIASPLFNASTSLEENITRLIQKARKVAEAGKYEQAIDIWEQVKKKHKELGDVNGCVHSFLEQSILALEFEDANLVLRYGNEGILLAQDAQTYIVDSIMAGLYHRKGEAFFYLEQLDSALVNIIKAKEYYQKYEDCTGRLFTAITQSVVYYHLDDFILMKKCLLEMLNEASNCHSLSKEDSLFVVIHAHNLLGAVYETEGNYDQMLYHLEEAQKLIRQTEEPDEETLISIHNNLGVAYYEKGDYLMAHNHYEQTLVYEQKHYNQDTVSLLSTLANQSSLLIKQSKYQSILNLLLPIVAVVTPEQLRSVDYKEDFITICTSISAAYLELEQYDSAQYYLQQIHPLCLESSQYMNTWYWCAGQLAYYQQHYQESIAYLEQSKQGILKKYDDNCHYKLYNVYFLLGDNWMEQQNWEKSLQYYQQALYTLNTTFRDSSILQNPSLAEVAGRPDLLKTLQKKAQALHQLYKDKPQQLAQALTTSELACEVIDELRRSYQLEEAKHFLATQAHAIYEQAIETALMLYEQTKDPIYQQKAFYFSERGKATILLEQMQEANAKQLATNIPDRLLALETKLQQDRWFYRKKIMEEQRKEEANQDSLKLANWYQFVWKAEEDLNELKQKLEKEYNTYHTLKYDVSYTKPEQLQQILATLNRQYQKDHVVMSYFMGAKHTYLFGLTEKNSLTHWIANTAQLRALLTQLHKNVQDQASDLDRYPTIAHQSYQQLVEPMAHLLADNSTLIIIPDGHLSYIPFETLLTKASATKNPRLFPYLFIQHPISYAYSATLWAQQMQAKEETSETTVTENFIGFAPAFKDRNQQLIAEVRSCGDTELSPLRHNIEEVKAIQNIVGGTAYLNVSATKDNFLAAAPSSKMVHIATHACAHDEQSMFNAIHLKDNTLLTYELFNLPLQQTELVTLSACQTGTGDLSKGEGVMSLSRAFTHAGCPSLIHSLWNADDWATAYLMERLYTYLKEGIPKSVALQKAKLDYVNNENLPLTRIHPFYWTNFIHSGNVTPVQLSKSDGLFSILWWLLGGLGLGMVVVVVWVKKK